MCDACKNEDHSWCDRTMKSRSQCRCTNVMCSAMGNEKIDFR